MMFQFFIVIAIINIVAIIFAQKYKVLPIIVQLLTAVFIVPAINYLYMNNGYNISNELKLSTYIGVSHFYKLNFALILGFILVETLEDKFQFENIKIAIPSFLLPFIAGIVTAYYYFDIYNILQSISLGLLFSITAVPVLYILLKNLGYAAIDMKKLLQSAIVIDLACWLIFGVTKDYKAIISNITVILLGLIPLFIYYLIKLINITEKTGSYIYGSIFFITILILEYYQYNILLFGIIYVLLAQCLQLKIALPINSQYLSHYQKWVAIPFILTFGMLQVNMIYIFQHIQLKDIILMVLPIIVKVAANYVGLYWYNKNENHHTIWEQSILLNTRGLTEIIFLNMLLSEKIINQKVYVLIMIMGLLSTLLPLFLKKQTMIKGSDAK